MKIRVQIEFRPSLSCRGIAVDNSLKQQFDHEVLIVVPDLRNPNLRVRDCAQFSGSPKNIPKFIIELSKVSLSGSTMT